MSLSKKEASEDKVKVATEICLKVACNFQIVENRVESFVSAILDAIELTGEDEPFTIDQAAKINAKVNLLRKLGDK